MIDDAKMRARQPYVDAGAADPIMRTHRGKDDSVGRPCIFPAGKEKQPDARRGADAVQSARRRRRALRRQTGSRVPQGDPGPAVQLDPRVSRAGHAPLGQGRDDGYEVSRPPHGASGRCDVVRSAELVGELHSQLLDRSRPCFRIYFIEGLPDRRFALFFKVHHAMVDGASAIARITASLDESPDARAIRPIYTIGFDTPSHPRQRRATRRWRRSNRSRRSRPSRWPTSMETCCARASAAADAAPAARRSRRRARR